MTRKLLVKVQRDGEREERAGRGAVGRVLVCLHRLQPVQLPLQPLQQGDLKNRG